MFGLTDSLKGTSTISASTATPGDSEYSSGSLTIYLVPTSDASHGTHARAIFVSSSGDHQGDETKPTSFSSVSVTIQKSGA